MPSTDINKKNFISYTYWCIFFALKIYWIEFIFTYVLWHRTDSNAIHNLGNIPFAKDELQRVASNAKEKTFLHIYSHLLMLDLFCCMILNILPLHVPCTLEVQ